MNEVMFLVTTPKGYRFMFDPTTKELSGFDIVGFCVIETTRAEAISILTDQFLALSLEVVREYAGPMTKSDLLSKIMSDFSTSVPKNELVHDWGIRSEKAKNQLFQVNS